MSRKIITVGRQFGSNGRAIAKLLAENLGIKFYDKELIEMAAEKAGIHPEQFAAVDEKGANPWLYAGNQVQNYPNSMLPINDVLFDIQSQVIRELADREECVIVGRAADYVLKDHKDVQSIFIYSPMEARLETVKARFQIDEKEARAKIRKKDKERKYYYNYYTDGGWGEAESYHLTIDSSRYGIEETAKILAAMIRAEEE
ncbi:cytidylate kinase-like family protein [Cuneatibacter sp. NSJ-177]|uniref:cytidylate kinase-like family protein n=1 Tax=Cuneatibacter sp. NSJ-177 TaxID=2931401 RepID=UPI001FD356C3|nr:cytidylate kinase-like family protein [Cuneatibacter sp. NSJ-177]MCJ7836197.1 cytidylate kinase-like family protein [Cuneatibacter sp. NSJ-177]